MAAPAATDADLQKIRPDILGHGIITFADQLGFAATDVLNLIKADWWPQAAAQRIGRESVDVGALAPVLNVAYLDDGALTNLVCYWALAQYIYPMLTKDSDDDGDAFSRRAERYRTVYAEEWARLKPLPLYDFNQDGSFDDIERRTPMARRVARA